MINLKIYVDYPKDKKLVIPGLVSNISNAYILADSTKKSLIFNKVNGDIVVNLGGQINPVLDVLVVEYQDDLVINPIVIKGKEGVVNLNDSQAIKHGKYGKLSYRSIIKDNFSKNHLIVFGINTIDKNTDKYFNSLILVNNELEILYQFNITFVPLKISSIYITFVS